MKILSALEPISNSKGGGSLGIKTWVAAWLRFGTPYHLKVYLKMN